MIVSIRNHKLSTDLIKSCLVIAAMLLTLPMEAAAPKREMRATWLTTVANIDWPSASTTGIAAQKKELTRMLDSIQSMNMNTVFFHIRPACDALYQSDYEPWSSYLNHGRGVNPGYDPLQFCIEECHKRGLTCHGWINPYRYGCRGSYDWTGNNDTTLLNYKHTHPEWLLWYKSDIILDPALPAVRQQIKRVVGDIINKYDIDGILMDDYFYPYPAAGRDIPDDKSYAQYNNGIADRADWRRHNVNELVRMMHDTIRAVKPWVKFGISPFGIYHNARRGGNVPGSATNGLENYEDLYADVLCWVNNGWVDYTMPQLYWQIGHPVADYATLINWWSENTRNRPLIIGESVENTIKYPDPQNPQSHQIYAKMNLARSLGTAGTCQWYAAAFAENRGNYAEALRQSYYSSPALPPAMPFISTQKPGKVKKLKPVWTEDGYMLFWSAPRAKKPIDEVQRYVVYRFAAGEPVNTEDASHIVDITSNNFLLLPYADGSGRYTYAVTALNRIGNESKAKKKSVKL